MRYLKHWIDSADEYYKAAQILENPAIAIPSKLGPKPSWYLLHLAIELYLKAVLINYDCFESGHDLEYLSTRVKELNRNIEKELNAIVGQRTILRWIKFINPFGYDNGGIRYLQKDKSMYAAPLGISLYYKNLVQTIKTECNLEKDISNAIK